MKFPVTGQEKGDLSIQVTGLILQITIIEARFTRWVFEHLEPRRTLRTGSDK
jgi:hypothetical protein